MAPRIPATLGRPRPTARLQELGGSHLGERNVIEVDERRDVTDSLLTHATR